MGEHQLQDPLGPNSTHQQVDTSPRTTIALQPAVPGPSLPTRQPTPALRHLRPLSQLSWDLAPLTSRPQALGHPGLSQLHQELAACQWASTNARALQPEILGVGSAHQ